MSINWPGWSDIGMSKILNNKIELNNAINNNAHSTVKCNTWIRVKS